jgi:hypothetical protein
MYKSSSGCSWSVSEGNLSNIVCNWKESEGCSTSENCNLLKAVNIECKDYRSSRGRCFFNGDDTLTDKHCSDIVDVTYCNQLESLNLCVYADKKTYINLINNSEEEYVCLWDAGSRTCRDKTSNTNISESNSTTIIIIIVVVVVFIISICILILIIIILYRRRGNNSDDKKAIEMDSIKKEGTSSRSEESQKKKGIL